MFIIKDRVVAGADRGFTYNLHGNVGGDSGGEFHSNADSIPNIWEVSWRKNATQVRCRITCDQEAELVVDIDEHSFAYGKHRTHNAARLKVRGKDFEITTTIIIGRAG